jgi:hypothetical protein
VGAGRRFRPLVLLIVLGVSVPVLPVVVWLGGWLIYLPAKIALAKRDNLQEYDRHRANYDAAVQAIAARATDPTRLYEYSLSRDRTPGSLRDGQANENDFAHATFARAWRDEKGLLEVRFLTKDLGHLGTCWLIYFQSGSPTLRTFRSGEKVDQVGSGWYAVYDPRG